MKRLITLASALLLLSLNTVFGHIKEDTCHVYVVDVKAAAKALDNFKETGNEEADAKALSVGQTVFPEFRTSFIEEKLITKHYDFPGHKFIITASVYYTDESMASVGNREIEVNDQSLLLGVAVAPKAQISALSSSTSNSAITEVTYDEYTNVVRAKQYVTVRGRSYLVGIQCNCRSPK